MKITESDWVSPQDLYEPLDQAAVKKLRKQHLAQKILSILQSISSPSFHIGDIADRFSSDMTGLVRQVITVFETRGLITSVGSGNFRINREIIRRAKIKESASSKTSAQKLLHRLHEMAGEDCSCVFPLECPNCGAEINTSDQGEILQCPSCNNLFTRKGSTLSFWGKS